MRAGFYMMNPEKTGRKLSKEDQEAAKDKEDISFSPLAMPLLWAILRVAPWLNKLIGKTGMTVITRLMGFIALSIGVQFIINGIAKFFGIG